MLLRHFLDIYGIFGIIYHVKPPFLVPLLQSAIFVSFASIVHNCYIFKEAGNKKQQENEHEEKKWEKTANRCWCVSLHLDLVQIGRNTPEEMLWAVVSWGKVEILIYIWCREHRGKQKGGMRGDGWVRVVAGDGVVLSLLSSKEKRGCMKEM